MSPAHDLDDAVVVALGSNLAGEYPSSRALLDAAAGRLAEIGLSVSRRSRWWRSAPWPDRADPEYLNGVVLVETNRPPDAVMRLLLDVEADFGRRRSLANAPRTLDLDLIAHGRTVVRGESLTLPHPRAADRLFVMGPLAEIAPHWVHPLLGLTAQSLAASARVGADATPVI